MFFCFHGVTITGSGRSRYFCVGGNEVGTDNQQERWKQIRTGALNGVDAHYATVPMPPGIPVAIVAIDGGKNADYLACSILSINFHEIGDMLAAYREETRNPLQGKSKNLQKNLDVGH